MKGRNMIYGNYQAGGIMDNNFMMPNGYNINSSYQAYGPNIPNNNYDNSLEERLSRIERQIRSIDQRVERLENLKEVSINNDSYMI